MTIITKKGNLLDAKGIIVHGCNCQGVMGSGVALAIKNKWPQVYEAYRTIQACDGLFLGEAAAVSISSEIIVVNALTQEYYGKGGTRYVNYEAIATAFEYVKSVATRHEMPVNFPLIGAGLGGGDWEIISTIINRTLGDDIEKILWVQ